MILSEYVFLFSQNFFVKAIKMYVLCNISNDLFFEEFTK
jgi:hypothetical protein